MISRSNTTTLHPIQNKKTSTMEPLPNVRSIWIDSLHHDEDSQIGLMKTGGRTYSILDVSAQEMNEWVKAHSLGRYFNRHIKTCKRIVLI